MRQSVNTPSPLISKALADANYDIVESVGNGWLRVSISGNVPGVVLVRTVDAGTLLVVGIVGAAEAIGLVLSTQTCPGATSLGLATSPRELLAALRLLRALVTQPLVSSSEHPCVQVTRKVNEIFRVFKNNEMRQFNEYRTRRLVLAS